MKKVLRSLVVMSFLILLVGCGKQKLTEVPTSNSPVKTCTIKTTGTLYGSEYSMNNEYKIYGTNELVSNVSTIEKVTSNDENVLNYFKETVDTQYKTINNTYGGYEYEFKKDGNSLTITTKVDYNKMDFDKYVSDNVAMKSYVNKDNKLTIEGSMKIYKAMGATCK